MVKLKGPAHSLAAGGSLAKAITFQLQGTRPTLKSHKRPKNQNTAKQISVRANVKWLSQQWGTLSQAERDTWEALSATTQLPPYQSYLQYNAKRWTHFLAPSSQYPATEAGIPPVRKGITATPGVKMATIRIIIGPLIADWGYILFRKKLLTQPPNHDNAVAFFPANQTANTFYADTPLESGTYFYNHMGFHRTGLLGLRGNTATVVVP